MPAYPYADRATGLRAEPAADPCPAAIVPGEDYRVCYRDGETAGWIVSDDHPAMPLEVFDADGLWVGEAPELPAALAVLAAGREVPGCGS
jgi:hypothetical protein